MKIDTNILKEYINKVSLSATIPMIDLNFTSEGVTTAVKNDSQVALAIGLLKKEAFEEYEEIGEIYIRNSRMLIEILKTFDDGITIAREGDFILKLSTNKRKVHIMLAEKKICANLLQDKKPDIEPELTFKIDKTILTKTVNDMKLLDVLNVNFVKDKTGVRINIGKKKSYDFITNTEICEDAFTLKEDADVKVGVGGGFREVVSSLGDSVTLKLASNKPLVFEDLREHMNVEFIVAPFVEAVE